MALSRGRPLRRDPPTVVGDFEQGIPAFAPNAHRFDWSDRDQAAAWQDLHTPLEKEGVRQWWLDYCCDDSTTTMPGLTTDSSNGHIEYINCIGDGNGRTAFAMYSARGFLVRECIAAHNGGSPTHSWSSGIQFYAVHGTPEENVIERSVSFENADGQKNNDGSGFIVDEETQGTTFVNNLGFRNGPLRSDLFGVSLRSGAGYRSRFR